MNKNLLLRRLERATNTAADIAIKGGMPISNKDGHYVGEAMVVKNNTGYYDVLSLERKPLYRDISVFDVAVIIAQRYSNGEFKTIEKVLVLENTFTKYHTDMLHYLHCIRGAKRRHDYDAMAILEDKFQVSEIRAKNTRDSLGVFKRVK